MGAFDLVRYSRRFGLVAAALAVIGTALGGSALAANDYLGVAPPAETQGVPQTVKTVCAACHGANGVATSATFPNLAAQNYNYLLKSLEDFRGGQWNVSPMNQMVASIPQGEGNANLKRIAAYFAHLQLDRKAAESMQGAKPTRAVAETGYKIYFQGNRGENVPACAACHMANGEGNAPMAIPALAGQNAAYVESQLQAFASGQRHNSPGGVMGTIAKRLSADEMKAVSAYVQEMRPDLLPGSGPKTFKAYVEGLQNQPVPGIPASSLSGSKGK